MKKTSKKIKLWSGRFSKPTNVLVENFTSSIGFDARLYKEDIFGSIAHVKMLNRTGLLKKSETEKIISGLRQIEKDIENGRFIFDVSLEDVHMNIESELIRRIGQVGEKLHTARSRNDQIALDMRLWLKRVIKELIADITNLQRTLVDLASSHTETVFPGYTHMQLAQPVIFAHHLLAYVEMLERDKGRLKDTYKRADELPLGCGALAGTSIPVDRRFLAKELGFSRISQNSLDAVSDRDFLIEYLSALAILAVHFSRFAEELVIWSSSEFNYIEIDDAFCTGSSMLPHKKNPDVAELVRGKTGQFISGLITLLALLKGLPLSYNRDMQEDKTPVFNATDTIFSIIEVLCPLVRSLRINVERIKQTLESSAVQAIDLTEYLVKKGVPFREGHFIVGKIVRYVEDKGKNLNSISLDELQLFSKKFKNDVLPLIDPMKSPEARVSEGGASPKTAKQRIRYWKNKLNKVSK